MSYLVTQRIRVERLGGFEKDLREANGEHITKPIFIGNWVMLHYRVDSLEALDFVQKYVTTPPKKKPWWKFWK